MLGKMVGDKSGEYTKVSLKNNEIMKSLVIRAYNQSLSQNKIRSNKD